MEQRTCNIIMCCKGHCKLVEKDSTMEEAIIAYMSAECDCPREHYNQKNLENIALEALYDYMNFVDRPGYELRQLFHQYHSQDPSILKRILTMFQLTQVRDKNGYVNGFSEELIEQSRIDLSPEKYEKGWN